MKIRRSFQMVLVVLLFAALVLSVAGTAATGASKVPVVVNEYIVGHQDGEVTFPGGNYHARGATHVTDEVSDNSCVDGPGFIDYKINANKNGHGNAHGTWILEPEAYDGTWEMTWHATTHKPIAAVGHGTGVFHGMSIKLTYTGEGIDDNGEYYLIFTGDILVPANAQVSCAE